MNVSFLKAWNLRTKLMIILVLFILTPLMIFGLLFYQRSNELVSQRTDKEALQVLTLVNQNVNQLLQGYESQLNKIYEHQDIMKQIGDSAEPGKNEAVGQTDDSVNRFLRDFLRGKDELDSIYLFTPRRTYFGDFKGPSLFAQQYGEHPMWERLIALADGRAVWLPSYELPPNQYNSKPSHYFAVGMQVKNVFNSLEKLGTLIVNVKIDALDRIIDSVQISPRSVIVISNSQGDLVWTRNSDAYAINLAQYSFFEKIDKQESGRFTEELNGSMYRIGFLRSGYNGWYYFSFVPQEDLFSQTNDLKRFLAATVVAFAALFILLAALTSNYITRPIRQMALAMKHIHKDNFDMTALSQSSSDEMGMLHAAFLSMRGRINELIKEVRMISNKEKEAEVRALQAQINPHFVYNSLDAINWMAIENDQERISNMITSLSDIMRYAIKPGEQLVTIEEELKWARNYAFLQEMRFEDKFEVLFDVRIDEMDVKVPRLMFQPYLENSIIHGMEDIDTGGVIRITVQISDEEERKLMVIVEDNGSGIPEEKLKLIRNRHSHGIGIYNLDDRLKMEYGSGFGATIQSVYGEGTTVVLLLPYIR